MFVYKGTQTTSRKRWGPVEKPKIDASTSFSDVHGDAEESKGKQRRRKMMPKIQQRPQCETYLRVMKLVDNFGDNPDGDGKTMMKKETSGKVDSTAVRGKKRTSGSRNVIPSDSDSDLLDDVVSAVFSCLRFR